MKKILLLSLMMLCACSSSVVNTRNSVVNEGKGEIKETYYNVNYSYDTEDNDYFYYYITIPETDKEYTITFDDVHYTRQYVSTRQNVFYVRERGYSLIIYIKNLY